MSVPSPWEFVLLALAAFRAYRLVARDTIAEPLRDALSYPDDEAVTLDHPTEVVLLGVDPRPRPLRVYVATLIRCRWCLGFYVSVAAWGLWEAWPHATIVGCVPLAVSAAVALTSKNLDPE